MPLSNCTVTTRTTHRIAIISKQFDIIVYYRFLDETTLRLIAEAKVRFESSTDEENSRRFLPQVLGIESLGIKDKLSMIFDMMLAALDTTTYSLLRTLFFMSKHPETQVRCRAALDVSS